MPNGFIVINRPPAEGNRADSIDECGRIARPVCLWIFCPSSVSVPRTAFLFPAKYLTFQR